MSQDDLPNVLRLYEELEVRPDEGVERLTARYRARLRELHPDRAADADPASDLAWLTRSYREAVGFHRRHGRLPGASMRTPGAGFEPIAPLALPRRRARTARTGRWRWPLSLAAIAALLAVVAYDAPVSWRPASLGRAVLERFAEPGTQAPDAGTRPPLPRGTVRIGSTTREVLQIQGPPMRREGARWHYGVSWIDFADDRVVDWYSAPSRPLRVDQTHGG